MASKVKTVDIGDGVDHPIKYKMSYVNGLKEKYKSLDEMLNLDTADYLPQLIFDGLVDKGGLTVQSIADDMDPGDVFRITSEVWRALSGNHFDFQVLRDNAIATVQKAVPEKNAIKPTATQ